MTGKRSGPDQPATLPLSTGAAGPQCPESTAATGPSADSSVRKHLLSEMDIYDLRDYLLATEF